MSLTSQSAYAKLITAMDIERHKAGCAGTNRCNRCRASLYNKEHFLVITNDYFRTSYFFCLNCDPEAVFTMEALGGG